MSVGNSVQVTTTETGWVLTKTVGDKKTEIQFTDENKNGRLDNADKRAKVISLAAGDLTTEEFNAAQKSISAELANQDGASVGDWYKNKATEEQEEARAEAFERQQRQQRMAQYGTKNKKNNFWNKAATFLGALCGFGGGFFSNGWQYNSGSFNDWNLRLFTTGVNGLATTSSLLNATYGNQLNATNYMSGGSTNMFSSDFINQMMNAQNEYLQNQKSQFDEMMETYNQAQKENQVKADAKATAQLAQQLSEEYANADESQIATANKNKIKEIYSNVKEDSEYTAEEKAILTKIKAYPQIPYDAVDDKGSNENGKFSTKVAKAINELLADYNSNKTDIAKNNVLSATSHTKLNELIKKAQQGGITEADLQEIDKIIDEWKKNKSTEEE